MASRQRHPIAVQLDYSSHVPAYEQIAGGIARLAATGNLRPGDRLPTVRELAAQLGLNFNTAARAYRILDRQGLVSAQQGRGTFVRAHGSSQAARRLTLQALSAQFVGTARRLEFSDAQIASAIMRGLKRRL